MSEFGPGPPDSVPCLLAHSVQDPNSSKITPGQKGDRQDLPLTGPSMWDWTRGRVRCYNVDEPWNMCASDGSQAQRVLYLTMQLEEARIGRETEDHRRTWF